jgi:hypothetical protein
MATEERDSDYLRMILDRLETCAAYRPRFGTGEPVTLQDFEQMYGRDHFYGWFGLDNPAVYAAHRAAGGITSLYRQIGLGCEKVFSHMLQDELHLSPDQANWSYEINTSSGRTRTLSLDARIVYDHVEERSQRQRIKAWVRELGAQMGVAPKVVAALDGVVFEVRQGYKSRDSKRQNADMANIARAYAHGYFPVFALLSTQVDNSVATRYRNNKCPVLVGALSASPYQSTYGFCKEVIGYDLAGFFSRNSQALRDRVADIINALLAPQI